MPKLTLRDLFAVVTIAAILVWLGAHFWREVQSIRRDLKEAEYSERPPLRDQPAPSK